MSALPCRGSPSPRAAVVVLLMRGEGESTDSGIRRDRGGYERCEGSPPWGCSGMGVGGWRISLQSLGTGSKKERGKNAEDLAKKQHFYETLTADMRRA